MEVLSAHEKGISSAWSVGLEKMQNLPFQNEMIHKTVTENLIGLHMFVQLGQTNQSANRHHYDLEDKCHSLRPAQEHVNENEFAIIIAACTFCILF